MNTAKKVYFASDFHLGVPNFEVSLNREKTIVRWLKMIAQDASDIFLVGDLFDFWFEHNYTIPKGFTRFLGTLADISDKGIQLHIFTGNHDMWMFDYLSKEINAKIYNKPQIFEFNSKKIFVGHGDGLGPDDHSYKLIKKIFSNKACQWLFARLHPNLSFGIAMYFSKKSRLSAGTVDEKYLGKTNEWLAIFAEETLKSDYYDYFVFGHRHLPINLNLSNNKSKYINLGEWINHQTFAVFDGNELKLEVFEKQNIKIYSEND